jgi:hypothetical protein
MLVMSAVQTNTGILISVKPGARMRRIVTTKLIPVSVVPSPDICSDQM